MLLTHVTRGICVLQVKIADGHVLSDVAAAEAARWMCSAGRHSHQSLLPWLWEVLTEHDLKCAPGEKFSLNVTSTVHQGSRDSDSTMGGLMMRGFVRDSLVGPGQQPILLMTSSFALWRRH